MRKTAPFVLSLFLLACQTTGSDKSPAPSKISLEKKGVKSPASYTQIFRELPLAASLTNLPWPSDSWTTIHGGAGFRWQLAQIDATEDLEDLAPFIEYPIGAPLDPEKLSPIEKLDIYLGNTNWDLTRKERARTLGQKNLDGTPRQDIPEWEGIMHAWSAASLQFEPVGPVTLQSKTGQSITFEKQDIYSLLSLFLHEQSPKPIVLASVCPSSEVGAAAGPYAFENEKQALRNKHCKALDPASFHTVLANQIGKLNEGFIMDRDNDGEISNNPVVAYESRLLEAPGEAPKPNTPRTVRVRTVVFITAEIPVNLMDEEDEVYPYETESYEYELNLDAKGKIVGGKWLEAKGTEANQAIPDFLWKSSPVWLNGPIKTLYEQARLSFAEQKKPVQLRPLEDMPNPERQSLNSYFNARDNSTNF